MVLYVIMIIVGLLILSFVGCAHKLKSKFHKTKDAFRIYDEALRKRWYSIPEFINIAKRHCQGMECEILKKIILLHNKSYDTMNWHKKMESDSSITKSIFEFLDLKRKNDNFEPDTDYEEVLKRFERMNEELKTARNEYIESVEDYNKLIKKFPWSEIAMIWHFEEIDL